MNLHEECLLKYLLNPTNLVTSTEILKLNNAIIEKSISAGKVLNNSRTLSCITNKV